MGTLLAGDRGQWLASIYLDLLRLLAVLLAASSLPVSSTIARSPIGAFTSTVAGGWTFSLAWCWAPCLWAIFAVEWLFGWVEVTGFWSAPPAYPSLPPFWPPGVSHRRIGVRGTAGAR